MKPIFNHDWTLSKEKAINLQQKFASKITKTDQLSTIKFIAGTDIGYKKNSDKLIAAVVIIDAHTLQVIESVTIETTATFPYISGLFSFREIPPLLSAFEKIKTIPDLIVCDGQGYAHPRRFGLACHLGLLMDIPAIGCAKNMMIGKYKEPDVLRGSFVNILDNDEIVGRILRTQSAINPVYVSTGHRISLETACNWILKLSPQYRLPETTRLADQLSKNNLYGVPS